MNLIYGYTCFLAGVMFGITLVTMLSKSKEADKSE